MKVQQYHLLAVVNGLAVLVLVLSGWFYRTEWGQTYFSETIMISIATITTIIAIIATILIMRLSRYIQHLKIIDRSLSQFAEDTSENIIENLEPVPVASSTSRCYQGWNRMLSAIEEYRRNCHQEQDEQNLGQFLCSYDSQRLLGLMDSMPDGILLAESGGSILLANKACEGLLSCPLSEFIGKSVLDLFDGEPARTKLDMLLNPKIHSTDNHFEITTDTEPVTILGINGYRLNHTEENNDILLIIRDISQQKISESSRDSFIAHVSHELRSPLTNIRAYAETLLSDMILEASAQKEAFNVINNETNRLIRLVNDVLDLSRLETGSLQLEKAEVITDRLIRQCVNDIKGMAAEKKISLQTNYHPKIPTLYADREKLAIVLNNILTNAVKYTPENGSVFIETNVDDNFLYIQISDTGFGIDEEDLNRIFEKFYRVDRKETATINGTGLGLATTKEIVMLHGGTIEVNSELNNGSEFLIKLPVTAIGPKLGPSPTTVEEN